MHTYTLTYARTVIICRTIEAPDEDTALSIALDLENAGELGLSLDGVSAKPESWVEDIQDEENVWEVELNF